MLPDQKAVISGRGILMTPFFDFDRKINPYISKGLVGDIAFPPLFYKPIAVSR